MQRILHFVRCGLLAFHVPALTTDTRFVYLASMGGTFASQSIPHHFYFIDLQTSRPFPASPSPSTPREYLRLWEEGFLATSLFDASIPYATVKAVWPKSFLKPCCWLVGTSTLWASPRLPVLLMKFAGQYDTVVNHTTKALVCA